MSPVSATDIADGNLAYRHMNYAAAFHAWNPLAVKGDAEAQYGMGRLYEFGQAVNRDPGMAYRWYDKARTQGHARAAKRARFTARILARKRNRQLQEYLRLLGYYHDPMDGIVGPKTVKAIRDFQRSVGLTVTGKTNPEMVSRLISLPLIASAGFSLTLHIGKGWESRLSSLWVHGKWCGPGVPKSGSPAPIDLLDRICMHHDRCYEMKGGKNCACDTAFISEAQREWKYLDLLQQGKAAYFSDTVYRGNGCSTEDSRYRELNSFWHTAAEAK